MKNLKISLPNFITIFLCYTVIISGLYFFHNAWISLLSYNTIMLIFIVSSKRYPDFKSIFSNNNFIIIITAIVISSLTVPIIYYLWNYVALDSQNLTLQLQDFQITNSNKLYFLLYFSIFHPVIEELFWRITVQNKYRLFSIYDFLFSIYHLLVLRFFIKSYLLIIVFIGLTAISLTWKILIHKYKQNLAVFLSHASADFFIMFTVLYFLI